jgi:phosphomannomutase
MKQLDSIFKAYDIRGIVGENLDEETIAAIGAAFVSEMDLVGKKIVIGYDMRPSSIAFAEAFSDGAEAAGAGEIHIIGLTSTDGLYYASGLHNAAGAMFTASHNPAQYNGIKLCLEGALGISEDTGLNAIKEKTGFYLERGLPSNKAKTFFKHETPIMEAYIKKLREKLPVENIKKQLHVVVDAGNGMGGLITPFVFEGIGEVQPLPFKLTPMFFELDGAFPNHPADPLNPENLIPLQNKIIETHADVGLAFDGDADRCFIVDEKGNPVSPSTVSAIIAHQMLKEMPGSTILYSKPTSRILKETIEKEGGLPYLIKVGHSTAKQKMKETGAVFGGEHSAHYYFKNFYGADSGMLAALYILAELTMTGERMSELAKKFNPYHSSGEINLTVPSVERVFDELIRVYKNSYDFDDFNGLHFSKNIPPTSWVWFNVRPSNTEPLLRINVESDSKKLMQHITNEVLNVIKSVR